MGELWFDVRLKLSFVWGDARVSARHSDARDGPWVVGIDDFGFVIKLEVEVDSFMFEFRGVHEVNGGLITLSFGKELGGEPYTVVDVFNHLDPGVGERINRFGLELGVEIMIGSIALWVG